MKVAIVHDWFLQYGGAERVVEVLHEIWPEAPVFTAFYSRKGVFKDLFKGWDIRSSFLQRAPFISYFPRLYAPLYPLAFESFDFTDFDVVISSDAFFAKRIITKPGTIHICLSEVVPHFLWRYLDLGNDWLFGLPLSPVMSYLRVGDYFAAQRVDYFAANSKTTAERIWKYYRREAEVIYLPVDTEAFGIKIKNKKPKIKNYFLAISRLTRDKRIDLAVAVCSQLGLPLKVVGEGEERRRLQKLAGPTVEFLGWKNHQEQAELYQSCRALIFPGEEDFGIVPVEAIAAGVPVIAFGRGGAAETVVAGRTGEFFYFQTADALAEVLESFDPSRYDSKVCRKQAEKFSKRKFEKRFKGFVEECFFQESQKRSQKRTVLAGPREGLEN